MQQVIDDFRGGLDVRKHRLSAPAGTLTDAVNCHITPGGEIENRKAFGRAAGLTGTFGLVALADSHVVFDSGDRSGTFPQVLLGQTVTFQRLQHPSQLDGSGTAYDASKHAMTAVVAATQFGGKAAVAATFADGKTYGYYDAGLMFDLTDGLVLAHLDTTAKIAAALAAAVNRTADYTAALNGTTVTISGTKGAGFSYETDNQTAAGTVAITKQNDAQQGVSSVQAVGSFTVVMGQFGAADYQQGFLVAVTVNGVDITSLGNSGNVSAVGAKTATRARTGSIVTLVYAAAHGLKVGDIVQVAGLGGVSYNGIFPVQSVIDAVTFSYDCGVTATEGTTADTNGTVKMGGLNPLLANGVQNSIYPQTFVLWGTSNEATAVVCALIINAMTPYSGYSAVATGNHVVITAVNASADLNNFQVGVSTAGAFVCDECSFAFGGSTFSVSTITLSGSQINTQQHPYPTVQTSNYALTTNVATITTGTQHGLYVNDKVVISGLTGTGAPLNGTWVVASVPTSTTFTFAFIHANITSAASAAGVVTIDSTVAGFYQRLVRDINSNGTACAATDGQKLYLGRVLINVDNGVGSASSLPGTYSNVAVVNVVVTFLDNNGVITTDNSGTLTVRVSQRSLTVTPRQDGFGGIQSGLTGAVRAMASGGVGPYVFAWSFVNGDDGFSITSPDAPATTFGTPSETLSTTAKVKTLAATFICKVTDVNGLTGFSEFVTVQVNLPKFLTASAGA